MIEATLVSGFLGAGKTTWLAAHLGSAGPVDLVVVNDFADEGVDHLLLRDAAGRAGARIAAVVGGCACCERLEDLRRTLLDAVNRHHRTGAGRAGHVIVETSGLAEPQRIARLLDQDPVLRTNVALRTLVIVVDGLDGRRLLRHRAAVRAQVTLADRIVLTRADLARDDELGELAATVRRLNPSAGTVASGLGHERPVVPVEPPVPDVFDDTGPEARDLRSWSVRLGSGTSWAEYALWLDAVCRAHPQRLLRSKGRVPTADGPLLVQSMGAEIARPVPADDTAGTSMVYILDGLAPEVLERSLRTFVPSAFPARPEPAADPVA
ncbi:GTP-binding protein [Pseudonocardia sp. RS11V-5]|uniref:CobW family GTP-binding protein n=1 Tax=Pseudonocardia terrae TaxID=2905831 RepID=UPI001E2FBBDF|nr:GTP-binding protein [Pseudonocardia terrae]MCE3551503.1 GTP-binding protein [Pseudonocardia terrae]